MTINSVVLLQYNFSVSKLVQFIARIMYSKL